MLKRLESGETKLTRIHRTVYWRGESVHKLLMNDRNMRHLK